MDRKTGEGVYEGFWLAGELVIFSIFEGGVCPVGLKLFAFLFCCLDLFFCVLSLGESGFCSESGEGEKSVRRFFPSFLEWVSVVWE